MGSWLSSMRRLWKHLSSCGWQKSFGRGGGVEPTSKPTLSFSALPTSVVSQLNCCNMFSLAPALKTTQVLRQMQNAAPNPRPIAAVSWSQACPVVSRCRVPSQVSSKQVEPRNAGNAGSGCRSLGGGAPRQQRHPQTRTLNPSWHWQGCLGSREPKWAPLHAAGAFLQNWVRKWILASQKLSFWALFKLEYDYNVFSFCCESAVRIYIFPPRWTSHPHYPHLGHHRAPSWAPFLYSNFPLAVCFTHASVFMSNRISQFIPPSSPSHRVPTSTLYNCIFIPALELGSSAPFF